jgi:hypothetical protein
MIESGRQNCTASVHPGVVVHGRRRLVNAVAKEWGMSMVRGFALVMVFLLFVFLSNLLVCIWVVSRYP